MSACEHGISTDDHCDSCHWGPDEPEASTEVEALMRWATTKAEVIRETHRLGHASYSLITDAEKLDALAARLAELERDNELFRRHVEKVIEPKLLARAEAAERALRQIADHAPEDPADPWSHAKAFSEVIDIARAALEGKGQ